MTGGARDTRWTRAVASTPCSASTASPSRHFSIPRHAATVVWPAWSPAGRTTGPDCDSSTPMPTPSWRSCNLKGTCTRCAYGPWWVHLHVPSRRVSRGSRPGTVEPSDVVLHGRRTQPELVSQCTAADAGLTPDDGLHEVAGPGRGIRQGSDTLRREEAGDPVADAGPVHQAFHLQASEHVVGARLRDASRRSVLTDGSAWPSMQERKGPEPGLPMHGFHRVETRCKGARTPVGPSARQNNVRCFSTGGVHDSSFAIGSASFFMQSGGQRQDSRKSSPPPRSRPP